MYIKANSLLYNIRNVSREIDTQFSPKAFDHCFPYSIHNVACFMMWLNFEILTLSHFRVDKAIVWTFISKSK